MLFALPSPFVAGVEPAAGMGKVFDVPIAGTGAAVGAGVGLPWTKLTLLTTAGRE